MMGVKGWLKLLAVLIVIIVAFLVVLSKWMSPWLKDRIIMSATSQTPYTVELEDVAVRLPDHVTLFGMTLRDKETKEVFFTVKRVTLVLDLLGMLRGRGGIEKSAWTNRM